MSIRQRTDRPDKKGQCQIFFDITWNNQQLLVATGVKCLPAHLQPNKKLTVSGKDLLAGEKNDKLDAVLAAISGVFKLASATDALVTPDQLKSAVALAAGRKQAAKPEATAAPACTPLQALYEVWKREHPNQSLDAARRYTQVVARLESFQPGLTLEQLTRPIFMDYLSMLYEAGLSDGTISHHVKFLRICHRLAERPVPVWLKIKVRYGRAVSLRREELQAVLSVDLSSTPYLERERERMLFQTLLLLRDSDLRRIKPHHITEQELVGFGRLHVLEFYQKKTGEEVRLPVPPAAVAIWQRWEGKVPNVTQQKRNMYLKEMARAAGLERGFVRVRYHQGQPLEEVLPLWQVVTTHTPRHTGADLVLWGSNGDQNLKEVALGHLAGASVYGYDRIERYGPLFLRAWAEVLATPISANTFLGTSEQADSKTCDVMVNQMPFTGAFYRVVPSYGK
nr:phage integrase SAM-like domain-containing protein [Hymenobacter nitidus]